MEKRSEKLPLGCLRQRKDKGPLRIKVLDSVAIGRKSQKKC